jgi:adenylate cyclase
LSRPGFFIGLPRIELKAFTQPRLSRHLPGLIAGLVIVWVCFLQGLPRMAPGIDVFDRLEAMAYDWRVRHAFEKQGPVANLGAVFIDDDSLQGINRNYYFSWPWPRQLHGRVVSELVAQGARTIGFDILFMERHPLAAETALLVDGDVVGSDEYFAQQLRAAGNVVLAAVGERVASHWQALLPAPLFHTNAWKTGHISSEADRDGVLRRVRAYYDDPEHGRIWHLGLVLAARELDLDLENAVVTRSEVYLRSPQGVERRIPIDGEGFFLIDWSLAWNDPRMTTMGFESVLFDSLSRAQGRSNSVPVWKDKVVVIGSIGSGNNLTDWGPTPLGRQTFLVSKHWNVANSVIMDRFIRRSAYWTETLLIVFLGSLAAVITWRVRALAASALVLLLLVFYLWLGLELYVQSRYWLPLILPGFGALLMTHVCMVTYRVAVEQKERHRVRSVFSRVVSSNVVSELLLAEKVALGGSRRKVTVYFADIRGFTEVTDAHQAQAEAYVARHRFSPAAAEAYLDERAGDVLASVSLYLGVVADTIKKHNGTLDKFIGDCVMAFWGAPTPNDQQAVECVRAAIEAQRAVHELNLQRAEENRRRKEENRTRAAAGLAPSAPLMLLNLGSGINTGTATVGLMGSEAHLLNYTVFGREVNLASRLESISGRARIVISESTYQELKRLAPDLAVLCTEEPRTVVKGIRDPIPIYSVRWNTALKDPSLRDTRRITMKPLRMGLPTAGSVAKWTPSSSGAGEA